jgi:hypothetical protein
MSGGSKNISIAVEGKQEGIRNINLVVYISDVPVEEGHQLTIHATTKESLAKKVLICSLLP